MNIKLGDLADAEQRIGVEIRILHLAIDEFRSFAQRHAEALDLSERAVGIPRWCRR